MTALLLLGPATPMLFQGQEFGSSTPFVFFADHAGELAERTATGRQKFLSQFANMVEFGLVEQVLRPHDAATFARCKLDWTEHDAQSPALLLHRDLLHLRHGDAVFRSPQRRGVDGAVLGPSAFVLRFLDEAGDDRLLIVNFGGSSRLREAPEPLLAPPEGRSWSLLWSSEDGRYGGCGHAALEGDENWHIPGEAAVVLAPGASPS